MKTPKKKEPRAESPFRGIEHPKKNAFLLAFANCGSIKKAAETVGCDRNSHYFWLKDDPAYVKMFLFAQDMAARALEDVAAERAIEASDTLLIFLLKCRNPRIFADRQQIEHSGKDGKPLLDLSAVRAYVRNPNG